MAQFLIEYYEVSPDAHPVFASPEFSKSEVIEAQEKKAVELYVEQCSDHMGHPYKKSELKSYGFDFISKMGAVKITDYQPPKIKKI